LGERQINAQQRVTAALGEGHALIIQPRWLRVEEEMAERPWQAMHRRRWQTASPRQARR
jgi:hypothetical protein